MQSARNFPLTVTSNAVATGCTHANVRWMCLAATAGYRGAATAGDSGAATAGDYGAATSRGSASVGANGIACARGNNVRVKGGLGAILVIAEEQPTDYNIAHWKAVEVDGETVKADTWYRLVDGKLVEAGDAE